MNIGAGLLAKALAPLAVAVLGFGTAEVIWESTLRAKDSAASAARVRLHLDHKPAKLSANSAGTIRCWQVRDSSVDGSAVYVDDQGNIYRQDPATGELQVLPLQVGFKPGPGNDPGWKEHPLAKNFAPVPVYFPLK